MIRRSVTSMLKKVLFYIRVAILRAPTLFMAYVLGKQNKEGSSTATDSSDVARKASENFVNGPFNCGEAIVAAFSESNGEEERAFTHFATGFGQGIAGKGMTCGGIMAGIMMLGKYGSAKGMKKSQVVDLSSKLVDGFKERFQTINCHELENMECSDPNAVPFDLNNCRKYIEYVVDKVNDLKKLHIDPIKAP